MLCKKWETCPAKGQLRHWPCSSRGGGGAADLDRGHQAAGSDLTWKSQSLFPKCQFPVSWLPQQTRGQEQANETSAWKVSSKSVPLNSNSSPPLHAVLLPTHFKGKETEAHKHKVVDSPLVGDCMAKPVLERKPQDLSSARSTTHANGFVF